MEISLCRSDDKYVYFSLDIDEESNCTSRQIAELFNLTTDKYNEILVEKVIQHKEFFKNTHSYGVLKNDISFKQMGTSRKVYIERFKEAFNPYLTLLIISLR